MGVVGGMTLVGAKMVRCHKKKLGSLQSQARGGVWGRAMRSGAFSGHRRWGVLRWGSRNKRMMTYLALAISGDVAQCPSFRPTKRHPSPFCKVNRYLRFAILFTLFIHHLLCDLPPILLYRSSTPPLFHNHHRTPLPASTPPLLIIPSTQKSTTKHHHHHHRSSPHPPPYSSSTHQTGCPNLPQHASRPPIAPFGASLCRLTSARPSEDLSPAASHTPEDPLHHMAFRRRRPHRLHDERRNCRCRTPRR